MRDFNFIDSSRKQDKEQIRESLTYWKDAWRRLKKNVLSMVGLVGVILIVLFGVAGPWFTGYEYDEQHTDYPYMPPTFETYQISDDKFVFFTQYDLFLISEDGEILQKLVKGNVDAINYTVEYDLNGELVFLDYTHRKLPAESFPEDERDINFIITYDGNTVVRPEVKIKNTTYLLGSDIFGRDVLTRLMYGARISLTVAIVAATVNLFIGVGYGSIAGFASTRVDNIMMRIVDIINSIPLVIYVILLMVLLDRSDMWTIIIALGTVYWVGMARLVRGQILSLKDQEFVLAARTIGVSRSHIITRHLIPNALGPIIVSLTMMIPTAIFTEAFLSFIGIGISAPQASWGTMANAAITVMETYPYLLLLPSTMIAITVLSFNFLGDGLRSALDPRLRKG